MQKVARDSAVVEFKLKIPRECRGFKKKKLGGGYSEVPRELMRGDSSTVRRSQGLCRSIWRRFLFCCCCFFVTFLRLLFD